MDLYDAVVVGGGPAGLTAAIYLARARCRVLVVEKEKIGGQITITAEVVNYPGVLTATGEQLTDTMRQQAISFGAEFKTAEVTGFDLSGQIKTVKTTAGEFNTFGVVLATGAQPRMAGFDGEQQFKGRGVGYCATCDGEFFTGLDVFVIGAGMAAAEESIFLTKYARHVTMLVRRDKLSCEPSVTEKVMANDKITVRFNTAMQEVHGDSALRGATLRNTVDGTLEQYAPPDGETFGVFAFVGYAPATQAVKGLVDLTDDGYIVTGTTLQTSCDGVFAAGDVCVKQLRQVVTAVSDGAVAAYGLQRYASQMREATGLTPTLPASPAQPTDEPVPAKEGDSSGFLTPDIRAQLSGLFAGMQRPVELRLVLDDRPVSAEVRGFAEEFASISGKLSTSVVGDSDENALTPRIDLWCDGSYAGLSFGGVPGGHEFNSFVVGVYNAAGPGQPLDDGTRLRIKSIDRPVDVKVLVSLSCTMCPTTVMSAQHIAALNPNVTARAFDLNHFPSLRERYHVMSVPCMVVGDEVHFGKMTVAQVLDAIGA